MKSRNILDRLFPAKYDFFDGLAKQAQCNALGISALSDWLRSGLDRDGGVLERSRQEADEIRLSFEKDLVNAFSTPIDREDLYLFSVDMDKVIEYALSTLLSMRAFGMEADAVIADMAGQLKTGADLFLEAVKNLKDAPAKSEQLIPAMRNTHVLAERLYMDGMAALFACGDPMRALKFREVYHHLKDASENLDYSVDTLHRIIVGLT